MGQQPHAGDVADGPQALPGAQVRVDSDALWAGVGADRLQAGRYARAPAGGHEQVVAAQFGATLEGHDVVVAVAPRGGRVHAQEELDAVALQDLPERVAQRRGLAGEDMLGALNEGHLSAEAAYGLRHLGADRAAAEYQQAPRDGFHAGHLAVGPDAVEVAQAPDGRHDRIRAGRQDHLPGGVAYAVDLHHARPGKPAGPAQQFDALARQPALLPGVGIVRDHEVAPGERRLDLDLRGGRRLACPLHRFAGAQQRLGRDAGPVGALTSHQLALDEGDPQAALGERPGAVLARRAAAHNDDVVVVAHVVAWVGCAACSSTMYCAYQVGQSASACPISSSCLPCAASARRRASASAAAES